MSFAINPSLNHIDISEPYIIEMYRSAKEILLPDARFKGHPCEAYICISKIEKEMKAYIALLETGIKNVFVYTSDYTADNSADYPKVFAEADEFVRSLGFSMERVNLDFSAAMREVIIKGFRVMRPPQKKALFRSIITDTQPRQSAAVSTPSLPVETSLSAPQQESLPAMLKSLQNKLSSARTVIERLTREKLSLEQNATREIAALKLSAEQAKESKRLSEEKFAEEIEVLKRELGEAASRKHDDLAATLKAELDSTLRQAEFVDKSFKEQITALQGRIETLENRNIQLEHELSAEKSSAAGKISQLTAEKITAADRIAALTHLETSWKEGRQREEDLCRNLDLLKEQTDFLEAELEKYREREADENVAALKIAALEEEIAAAGIEIKRLGDATLDQAAVRTGFKDLAEAKNDVEAEYIRLANETMKKETEMLDALYAANAEILRLSRELEIRSQAAEMEKAALQEELKQMLLSGAIQADDIAAGKQATVTTATTAASISVGEPELHADATGDDTTDAPVIGDPEIINGLVNEFGNFCGSSGYSTTEFSIAPAISMIEYSDPAEIVAIISSSNTVQAVPDGSKIQRCKGYAIATKKDGEYKAYVAWHLTESGKVVVCTPEQQPADSRECAQILQDAITYFEIVGFMMELEDLGSTKKSYNKVIQKVPALSRK